MSENILKTIVELLGKGAGLFLAILSLLLLCLPVLVYQIRNALDLLNARIRKGNESLAQIEEHLRALRKLD